MSDPNKPAGKSIGSEASISRPVHPMLDPIYLEFLHEIFNSAKLEEQFREFKNHLAEKAKSDPRVKAEPFNDAPARKEIGEVIQHILRHPLEKLLGPYDKQWFEMLRLLKATQQQLAAAQLELKKIDDIQAKGEQTARWVEDLHKAYFQVKIAQYHSTAAQHRFEKEYPKEKLAIATHVAETYFKTPLHCFFQASTTAFHLADILRQRKLGNECVVHTNSFALPHMLLGFHEDSEISVYPVCGKHPDHRCAGWTFSTEDKVADAYLRGLFDPQRGDGIVTTAFITPQFVDIYGTCYFAKEQTVNLVKALLECSPNLVLLTPGPRILKNRAALDPMVNWGKVSLDLAMRRTHANASLNWIVGGEFNHLDANDCQVLDQTQQRLRSKIEKIAV